MFLGNRKTKISRRKVFGHVQNPACDRNSRSGSYTCIGVYSCMFNRLLKRARFNKELSYDDNNCYFFYEFVLQVQNQFMFQIDMKIILTIKHFINNIFSLFITQDIYISCLFSETLNPVSLFVI